MPNPSSPAEPVPVSAAVDSGTARLLPDLDRKRAWLLTVDGAPQSHVDLDDPGHLEFEYLRRLAHVVDTADDPARPLDLLHLGGGALTLPRYAAHTRPGSRQLVAERDGALAALVAERLPADPAAGISVRVEDAAAVLASVPPASVDVLVCDVFQGDRTPAQVTTAGFAEAAGRALRPGGRYAANLADHAPFGFLRSQLATLSRVFDEICLIAEPGVLHGRRFGNAVVVAGHAPLPLDALIRRCAADPFPARVVHGGALRAFTGTADWVREADARPSPQPPPGAFSLG